MTPEQMRELADILEPMAAAPRFDGLPVAEFCAWLRQCAEQRPVAYKHTESDGGMTYFVADEAPCEKCVPLYAAPVPPQREPVSDSRPCTCHPDDNPPVPCAQKYALSECREAQQREPLSDEGVDAALQTDAAVVVALVTALGLNAGEFKSVLRRLARAVERAHGIGGSDER